MQPAMQEKRYDAGVSNTAEGLFVTGGKNGEEEGWFGDQVQLTSTEYFSSGQWVSGPVLPKEMSGHCQVTFGSSVVVIGMLISNGTFLDCINLIYRR